MAKNTANNAAAVFDVAVELEDIYQKPYIAGEYIQDIKNADVLLIPSENVREGLDFVFPETTSDFYRWLKTKKADTFRTEIAVSDEYYIKLSLNTNVAPLSTIFVKEKMLEEAVYATAEFLTDFTAQHHRYEDELLTVINILIERDGTNRKIMYQGTVSGWREKIQKVLADAKAGEEQA